MDDVKPDNSVPESDLKEAGVEVPSPNPSILRAVLEFNRVSLGMEQDAAAVGFPPGEIRRLSAALARVGERAVLTVGMESLSSVFAVAINLGAYLAKSGALGETHEAR